MAAARQDSSHDGGVGAVFDMPRGPLNQSGDLRPSLCWELLQANSPGRLAISAVRSPTVRRAERDIHPVDEGTVSSTGDF